MNEKNAVRRKTLVVDDDFLTGLGRFHFRYGYGLLVSTVNDVLISAGICPDLPTSVAPVVFEIDGVWRAGLQYTQHEPWEEHLEVIFGPLHRYKN